MDLIKLYKKSTIRVGAIQLIVVLVFLYLILGAFYRQIIQHKHFLQKEHQQSTRRIVMPAVRGKIYDRNGELLVDNRPIFLLELHLSDLKSKFREEYLKRVKFYVKRNESFNRSLLYTKVREDVVNDILKPIGELLNRKLFLSGQVINRHLNQRSLLPFVLINELTLEEYDKLINYLPVNSPVNIRASSTRYYPNGRLACHVLGYTVLEDSKLQYDDHIQTFSIRQQNGKSGVEKSANDILKGENGMEMWLVAPSGEKRNLEKKIETKNGKNITLSIDKNLQSFAENALKWYTGAAVAMDTRTGEVLLMASSPNYDPNLLYPTISQPIFNEISNRSAWLNQAIQCVFPPGSVFKVLSAVAFLKSPEFDPSEKIICTGRYFNGRRKLRCNNHPHGEEIDLHLALGKSCNVYIFDRASKIGGQRISEEAKRYGLNRKTMIELPFESNGMIIPDAVWKKQNNLAGWCKGDTLNLSIGQGYVLTTPLNICSFTASLAKNRLVTKPTIFKSDKTINEQDSEYLPREVYQYVIDAMTDCVKFYTGKRAKIDGIEIAGKTGSAQFKENGKKRNIAWFTCFAPVENPEIAVTVMIREDRDGLNYHGGSQAAPVACKILKKYFNLD